MSKTQDTEATTLSAQAGQNYNLPTLEELLEAGVHFGHQTRRWHPKIAPFLYKAENKIHIFDLIKTYENLKKAADFVYDATSKGKTVCFLGTKKQAAQIVKDAAIDCGAFYVTERWTGGMITNFDHVRNKMTRLKEIEEGLKPGGKFEIYTKKERLDLEKDGIKLEKEVGGVRHLNGVPDILYIVDIKKELTAVHEALKREVPVVAIVDSNCDPSLVNYVIPGNDDASRSIEIITKAVANAAKAGYQAFAKRPEKSEKVEQKPVVEVKVKVLKEKKVTVAKDKKKAAAKKVKSKK